MILPIFRKLKWNRPAANHQIATFFDGNLVLGNAFRLHLGPTTGLCTSGCRIRSILRRTSQYDSIMVRLYYAKKNKMTLQKDAFSEFRSVHEADLRQIKLAKLFRLSNLLQMTNIHKLVSDNVLYEYQL